MASHCVLAKRVRSDVGWNIIKRYHRKACAHPSGKYPQPMQGGVFPAFEREQINMESQTKPTPPGTRLRVPFFMAREAWTIERQARCLAELQGFTALTPVPERIGLKYLQPWTNLLLV